MAIINRLRFVDILRDRLGDQTAREFTEALQDEMAPVMSRDEIQVMIHSLLDQFEARIWRVGAIFTAIYFAGLAIAVAVLIAVLS